MEQSSVHVPVIHSLIADQLLHYFQFTPLNHRNTFSVSHCSLTHEDCIVQPSMGTIT